MSIDMYRAASESEVTDAVDRPSADVLSPERPLALATLPATATAAEIKETTDRDGAVIVRQVLSPDLLARISADLEPYLAGINPRTDYDGDAYGAFLPKTKRLEGLAQKSDAVVEAILDPRYLEWAEENLEWCGEIQLNAAQLIEIAPGEEAQVLHRDEGHGPKSPVVKSSWWSIV